MYVNLQQLRVFYLVISCKSMAAAAKKLFVSRAAVTMQIRNFEEQLGFELFSHKRGGLVLTEHGSRIYLFAKTIFEEVDNLERYVDGVMRDRQDVFMLGAHHVMAQYFLPSITEHVQLHWPNLRLQVVLGTRGTFVEKILAKEIHAAIILGKAENSQIVSKTLFADNAVLVSSPDGFLAKKKVVHVEELANVPLILQQTDTGVYAAVQDFLQQHAVKPLIHLENISSDIIKTFLIQKQDTVAFIPRYAVQKELENGLLSAITVAEGLPVIVKSLIYLKQSKLPFVLQMFIEALDSFDFFSKKSGQINMS